MAGTYHTNTRTPGTGGVDFGTQTTAHNWIPGPEYYGPNGAGNRPNGPKLKPVGGMADTVQPGGEPVSGDQGSINGR